MIDNDCIVRGGNTLLPHHLVYLALYDTFGELCC